MKRIICAVLAVLIMLTACSKPAVTESESVAESQSIAENSAPESSFEENKTVISPYTGEHLDEAKAILEEFGESMINSQSFIKAQEIDIDRLILWYGYRLQEKNGGEIPQSDVVWREENAGASFPADKFENEVYKYFGISSEFLRSEEAYDEKLNAYPLPCALYPLAEQNVIITNVTVSGSEFSIYFIITVAENIKPERKLIAEKSGDDIRFVSYTDPEGLLF